MSEWQPIETAPKDGTEILVFIDGNIFQAHQDEQLDWCMPFAKAHGCGCCGWNDDKPTHWMPLPPPPKEQA